MRCRTLVIVERTGGWDSTVLADRPDLHRVIGRNHGRQRYDLGCNEDELAQEYRLLIDVAVAGVERHATARPEDAALASGVMTRLLMHARADSIQAYRRRAPSLSKPKYRPEPLRQRDAGHGEEEAGAEQVKDYARNGVHGRTS
jgi:hypothetical protein